MDIHPLHSWEVTTGEAREIQLQLRQLIDINSPVDISRIRVIAAADVSFHLHDNVLYAGVGLFHYPGLELINVYCLKRRTDFPYIPGFLSFREIPPLLEVFKSEVVAPDILICDGQGIAHPRGLGLASHLGLILQIPTIGCAKSLLVGQYQEPGMAKGSRSEIWYQDSSVGVALRTRHSVKPVYVSCGHKISIDSAVQIIMHCAPRYRIPQPVRVVHQKVNEFRRMDAA